MRYLIFALLLFPMTLSAQTNVGIGTGTPLSKLDIMAQGDGAEILRFSTDRPWVFKQRDNGIYTKLSLQSTINDKAFEIMSADGLNRAAVFLSNNIHSNVLLVPDGGEAGVGVEDPTGKFHIRHNSTTGWPQLRLTEIGQDYARIKFENDSDPGVFWDVAGQVDSVLTNSRINFFYSGPNGIGDRMTILGNGNIGINKTSPEAMLDIKGGNWNLEGGSPGDLRIGTSAANALRIGVATGGGGAGTVRMYAQGGTFFLGTNNNAHMAITTFGNIGIGETNPNNKVKIVGSTSSTAHVLSVSAAYSGSSDVRAIEGFSTPNTGFGIGGYFQGGYRGIQAYALGTTYSGQCIAIEASATGSAGTRIGLFAQASGGSTNWAGYFSNGNVYVTNELRIGSGALGGAAGYKVAIDGKLIAEGVRVQLSQDWPDYVFSDNYDLMPLDQLRHAIAEHGHLPGIPSAQEVRQEGIDLGEMQTLMMEKIEELTLHLITLDQENKALNRRISELEQTKNQ